MIELAVSRISVPNKLQILSIYIKIGSDLIKVLLNCNLIYDFCIGTDSRYNEYRLSTLWKII